MSAGRDAQRKCCVSRTCVYKVNNCIPFSNGEDPHLSRRLRVGGTYGTCHWTVGPAFCADNSRGGLALGALQVDGVPRAGR